MSESAQKTIRVLMPQWQGGNNPPYYFGAQLLAWLAPETNVPIVHVPVPGPTEEEHLVNENGIVARAQVVSQLSSAYKLIEEHAPDKIAMLGGDCLVDLAPFAYLSDRYKEKFGILWIDTHPDIMTPEHFEHAHAHVLGNLMGNGDPDLTAGVKTPVPASRVMIAGLVDPLDHEAAFIKEHGIRTCTPEELRSGTTKIADWIRDEKITHLAIHLDLDVLNFMSFRGVLFAEPNVDPHKYDGISKGKLEMSEVLSLVKEVESKATVVGFGVAEHLPWDMINLKKMLSQLPVVNE